MPQATVCGSPAGFSAVACARSRPRRRSQPASSRFGLDQRSDASLVALAQTGAESAYEEILRRYRRQLHAYCAQMLGPSRAEDAVQQAFLQAFVALRRGGDREIKLRPWLYRISHNCSIDMLRKNGWDYDQLDPDYDGVAQPPQLLEQKEDLANVVGAMRALPERQRRALTLRELEGRSYREIGAELGHSEAGVRQLIFRARTALRGAAAAIALPFLSVRSRFSEGVMQLTEGQQAAFAASVGGEPAGAGLAKAGAVLVAGVSMLAAGPVEEGPPVGRDGGGIPAAPIESQATSGTNSVSPRAGDDRRPRAPVAKPVPQSIQAEGVSVAPMPPAPTPVEQAQPQTEQQAASAPSAGQTEQPATSQGPAPQGEEPGKPSGSKGGSKEITKGGGPKATPISGATEPKRQQGRRPSRLSQPAHAGKLSLPKQPAQSPSASKPGPKSTRMPKPSSPDASARSKPVGAPKPTVEFGNPGPGRGQNPTKTTGKGSPAPGR